MHYAVVIAWEHRSVRADDYTINWTYERDEEIQEYVDCEWDVVSHQIIFDYRVIWEGSRWKCPFKLKKNVDRHFDKEARVNEFWNYKRNRELDPDESRCYQCIKRCIDYENSLLPEIYIDENWEYHELMDFSEEWKEEWNKKYKKRFESLPEDMLLTVVDVHL